MTEFNHYMDDELIRFVQSKEKLTPLEAELLKRLMKCKRANAS
jgi:hypothetical protein